LIFTFSRGAWLGFILTLLLMLNLSTNNIANKLVFLIPIFIGIFILVPELRNRIMFTFTPQGDADRIRVWRLSIIMIKENPILGQGIGLFMNNFTLKELHLSAQYAHNCYLQVWAETGIFSLLSFIGFLGMLIINGIRVFLMNQNFLVLGLVCGLFGFLVHSFFDTQFYSLQAAMFFWSMAGILNVLSERRIEA
jgi:O-antigen ligase